MEDKSNTASNTASSTTGSSQTRESKAKSIIEDVFRRADKNVWQSQALACAGRPGSQMVGYVTSVAFGYTVGKPICIGYVYAKHAGREAVSPAYLREGSYEIDIAGNMRPAEINLTPLYDPKSLRVKM